jgi:ribosome biogenesis protein Nip4
MELHGYDTSFVVDEWADVNTAIEAVFGMYWPDHVVEHSDEFESTHVFVYANKKIKKQIDADGVSESNSRLMMQIIVDPVINGERTVTIVSDKLEGKTKTIVDAMKEELNAKQVYTE